MLHLRVPDDVQTKIPEFVTQEEVSEINLQKIRGCFIKVKNLKHPKHRLCYKNLVPNKMLTIVTELSFGLNTLGCNIVSA